MTLRTMLFMRDTVGSRLLVRLENLCANKDPRFDEENLWHIHYDLLEHSRLSHPGLAGIQLRIPSSQIISNVRLEKLIRNLYFKLLSLDKDNSALMLVMYAVLNLLKNFPSLTVSNTASRYLRLIVHSFIFKANASLVSLQRADELLKIMKYLQSKSSVQILDRHQKDILISMMPERHPHLKLMSKI